MPVSNFLKKLFSPIIWLNVLGIIIAIVLIGFSVVGGMSVYTRHGQAINVPDVERLSMSEARKILHNAGLSLEVTDTGYVKELPMDCVLEQNPSAGDKVKPGRRISIIVNASSTPTIALPDIVQNCSLREAVARLKSMGFKVGDPEYVRGEKEWVYGITVDGRQRTVGDRIPINKVVVVQAGNGYMEMEDSVVYVDIDYEPIEDNFDFDGNDVEDDFVELVE